MFTKLRLQDFKKLQLLDHLKCRKRCRNASFRLLNLYLTYNPLFSLEKFFKDEISLNRFKSWKKMNNINYNVAESLGPFALSCKGYNAHVNHVDDELQLGPLF